MSLSVLDKKEAQSDKFQVKLKPFQDSFVFSPKMFPAFIAGWGTGKSLSLISRAMIYSQYIPDNLGIIFRKEYTDLRDSTVQDFEKYTRLKVNSQRDVDFTNKSKIMFRHIEELNNIQNVNLGWFAIEQIDELETDKEFFMLWGRLRRDVKPMQEFLDFNLPLRSGFVIGNVGRPWVKKLWKDKRVEDYDLSEATTFDNKENLPTDFISNMERLAVQKPEIYNRFVVNDWSAEEQSLYLIKESDIELLKTSGWYERPVGDIIAIDPATGGDECVIYVLHNYIIIDKKFMHERDTMKIVGEAMLLGAKYDIENYAVDSIGVGKGVADRLAELKKNVFPINSSESATEKNLFYNRRTEMWWHLMKVIMDKAIPYPDDSELIRQLTSVMYKVVNSNGLVQLEHKADTKKRLDRSPDRADAYVYGVWATQFCRRLSSAFKPYAYTS